VPLRAAGASKTTSESIRDLRDGVGRLEPATRLVEPALGECSGMVLMDGLFFAHNDSGDGPNVFVGFSLDFSTMVKLRLDGAGAYDWEDIAVIDGELLIADTGDNLRVRSPVTLYRARYLETAAGGRLERTGTYPVAYPDGKHDAEALFALDGKPVIISKDRGEGTGVYTFDALIDSTALEPGRVNVARRIGTLQLEPGEQVTGADLSPDRQTVVLLTYRRILRYPVSRLDGEPEGATRISLLQCEAICFQGDRLVIANEQREVYVIDDFLNRRLEDLRPVKATVTPR